MTSQLGNPSFISNQSQEFAVNNYNKNKTPNANAIVEISSTGSSVSVLDFVSVIKCGYLSISGTATSLVLPPIGELIAQFNWAIPAAGSSATYTYVASVDNAAGATIPANGVFIGSVAATSDQITTAKKFLMKFAFTLTNSSLNVTTGALVVTGLSTIPVYAA